MRIKVAGETLLHTFTQTEYAGSGRIRGIGIFGGAGYCIPVIIGRGWDGKPLDAPGWRPNLRIPGFNIMLRTVPTSVGTPLMSRWEKGFLGRFMVTRNPNLNLFPRAAK